MRRLSLASFAASVVLAGSLLAASAPPATAGTLDQSQTDISLSGYNIGSNQWVAQTFTAGLSGPLDQVDLYMYTTICTPPADLTVEIRNVSSGVPTGTALATATVDKASVPISPADWVPALFPTPTSVSAGDSYAIVASTTANCPGFDFGPYVWRFVGGDPYGDGNILTSLNAGGSWNPQSDYDAAFKSYVVPWTLTVSVTGTGTGTVTGTGIDCPGDCTETYADGTSVTLNATPTGGSAFDGWGGDCLGSGSCQLTMDADTTVSASFTAPSPPGPQPEPELSPVSPPAPQIVPTPPEPPTCKGKPATIVGTSGSDVRKGTSAKDVMVGLGGNDKLSGLAGNDLICGGKGKDTLKGGKGNDTLLGQKGKDTLKGGPGKDKLKGGAGKDKQVQ